MEIKSNVLSVYTIKIQKGSLMAVSSLMCSYQFYAVRVV